MKPRARWTLSLAALLLASACSSGPPLQKAAAFVRKTKSARVTVQPKMAGAEPRVVEVQCPDRVRVVTKTPAGRHEVVVVGEKGFSRTGEGPWTNVPPSFANVPSVCQGVHWRASADLAAALSAMASSPATPGPIRTPMGVPCKQWTLRRQRPATNVRQLTQIDVCLATDDARPIVMDVGDEVWVFTEWNGTVKIEAPDVGANAEASPTPSPAGSQPGTPPAER